MEIYKIISKPTPQELSVEEMSFVVEAFIKEKTGKEVTINLMKGLNEMMPGIILQQLYLREVNALMLAFNHAAEFYHKKEQI